MLDYLGNVWTLGGKPFEPIEYGWNFPARIKLSNITGIDCTIDKTYCVSETGKVFKIDSEDNYVNCVNDIPRTRKVACGGHQVVLLLQDGNVWMKHKQTNYQPICEKSNIFVSVSCGRNFSALLKANGDVYLCDASLEIRKVSFLSNISHISFFENYLAAMDKEGCLFVVSAGSVSEGIFRIVEKNSKIVKMGHGANIETSVIATISEIASLSISSNANMNPGDEFRAAKLCCIFQDEDGRFWGRNIDDSGLGIREFHAAKSLEIKQVNEMEYLNRIYNHREMVDKLDSGGKYSTIIKKKTVYSTIIIRDLLKCFLAEVSNNGGQRVSYDEAISLLFVMSDVLALPFSIDDIQNQLHNKQEVTLADIEVLLSEYVSPPCLGKEIYYPNDFGYVVENPSIIAQQSGYPILIGSASCRTSNFMVCLSIEGKISLNQFSLNDQYINKFHMKLSLDNISSSPVPYDEDFVSVQATRSFYVGLTVSRKVVVFEYLQLHMVLDIENVIEIVSSPAQEQRVFCLLQDATLVSFDLASNTRRDYPELRGVRKVFCGETLCQTYVTLEDRSLWWYNTGNTKFIRFMNGIGVLSVVSGNSVTLFLMGDNKVYASGEIGSQFPTLFHTKSYYPLRIPELCNIQKIGLLQHEVQGRFEAPYFYAVNEDGISFLCSKKTGIWNETLDMQLPQDLALSISGLFALDKSDNLWLVYHSSNQICKMDLSNHFSDMCGNRSFWPAKSAYK